jgi:hypothetical protein
MALTNYADLQTSVANFLHRSDLTSIIPDLIQLAEAKLYKDIDAKLQDTVAQISATKGVESVSLPNDFINMRSLVLLSSPNVTLDYYSPDAYYAAKPWNSAGTPAIYTIINNTLYLQDIPDSNYSLKVVYRAKIPTLATASTNWLMTNFPNVYLYGTLSEAAPYMMNDERLPVWNAKYQEAILTVNQQDWANAATMRVRSDVRL